MDIRYKPYITIAIIVFFSAFAYSQDTKHIGVDVKSDWLENHKENYRKALMEKNYAQFFSSIDSVKNYFYSNMQFDSMLVYSLYTAEIASQIDSADHYAHNSMNVAEIYKMSHKLNDYNDIVLSVRGKNLKLNRMNQMRLHGHMEAVFKHKDMLDSAVSESNKGLEIARIRNDSLSIAAFYRNLAQTTRRQGNLSKAIEFLITGNLYISDEEAYIKAQTYRSIGDLFINIDDVSRAEEYFKLGFELTKGAGYEIIHSEFLARLGLIAKKNNDNNEARRYYRQSLEYTLARNKKIFTFQNFCSLAAIEITEKNYDAAELILDSAFLYFGDHNGTLANAKYKEIYAELRLKQGRFKDALVTIKELEDYVRSSDMSFTKVQLNYLQWQYAIGVGDISNAYFHLDQYHRLKDSLDKVANGHRLHTLEFEYNRLQQDKTIANLNLENQVSELKVEAKNRWLFFGGIGLVILSGLLALTTILFVKNRKKKAQLEEQNIVISSALKDKNTLLKEIHHRVKNNLQVISSLLGLQSRYVKDDNVLDAIKSGRSRVQSMSLLHQNLYRNDNLKGVDMKQYFTNLAQNLFDTYNLDEKNITLDIDIADIDLDIDSVVPIGLITNELISNALKHAFKNRTEGKVTLSLNEKNGCLELRVKDNGIGLATAELPQSGNSLGINLIQSFAEKLDADISIQNEQGTDITFSIRNYVKAG